PGDVIEEVEKISCNFPLLCVAFVAIDAILSLERKALDDDDVDVLGILSLEQKFKGRSRERGVSKLTTGRLVNGSSCGGINMVLKYLDLEPKIDAMMRDVLDPSWWKELSTETSSKILPCEDGSYWKTFKPIASLIAKGKLK
ncbi:hypothetical protein Tco_1189073, partial [Tanacetum coccineum]